MLILKVIICTDGKANTELGNLEVEDNDARTLLSSAIFYQELGDYAANEGWVTQINEINGEPMRNIHTVNACANKATLFSSFGQCDRVCAVYRGNRL